MGYELVDEHGKELHINAGTSQLLSRLTAGWGNLLGIPNLINKQDCRMLARVLRNYASLQRRMGENDLKVIRWDKECEESLEWIEEEAVPFFEICLWCKRNDG